MPDGVKWNLSTIGRWEIRKRFKEISLLYTVQLSDGILKSVCAFYSYFFCFYIYLLFQLGILLFLHLHKLRGSSTQRTCGIYNFFK